MTVIDVRPATICCALEEVIESSSILAYHRTKLVEGVHWSGEDSGIQLLVPRTLAVSAITTALASLADAMWSTRQTGGIRAAVHLDGPLLTIELLTDLAHHTLDEVSLLMALLLGKGNPIGVFIADNLLVLEMPALADESTRRIDLLG